MESRWTRRVFLSSMPFAFAAAETLAAGPRRFRDGATEFEVIRYTEPDYNSRLPASDLRAFSSRNSSFLLCSDESGTMQPYFCDMKTAQRRLVYSCEAIDPATLSFTATDRNVVCFDGRRLVLGNTPKPRTVYEVETGWERGAGMQVSDLGVAFFTEIRGGRTRVRSVGLLRAGTSTLAEVDGPVESLSARPRRSLVALLQAGRVFLCGESPKPKALPLAAGQATQLRWSSNGRALLYLNVPEDRSQLIQLREYTVESDTDKLIAKTSQYATFARNGDASVFAGISSNVGSPYVLLLVRSGRRELTVCEHRATHPEHVKIFFTPNSKRLVFDTDRHGKSVIYGMDLENLVDETEE